MCVLSDHQPANHQQIERSVIGEITEGIAVNTVNKKGYCAQAIISELEDRRAQLTKKKSDTVMFEAKNEHCAQDIISELEDARAQRTSSKSNTVVIEAEIHAENTDAQQMVLWVPFGRYSSLAWPTASLLWSPSAVIRL